MPRLALLATLLVALACAACGASSRVVRTTAPRNATNPDSSWSLVAAPGGHTLLVGVVRSPIPGPRVGVLLVTGTEGLNADYPKFARELAARGFDVAFGCWFSNVAPDAPTDVQNGCADAPEFLGVADAAIRDLDALVAGARSVLGDPQTLALVGFSRGGGIVMLRAADGAPEPVVSIAGMLEGTSTWGQLPGEVDVVQRADGISAPVLLLHGEDDGLVPVAEATDMERTLRAYGADVEVKYYPGAGHGLAQVPEIRADMLTRITAFLCARYDCNPSVPGAVPGPVPTG